MHFVTRRWRVGRFSTQSPIVALADDAGVANLFILKVWRQVFKAAVPVVGLGLSCEWLL